MTHTDPDDFDDDDPVGGCAGALLGLAVVVLAAWLLYATATGRPVPW